MHLIGDGEVGVGIELFAFTGLEDTPYPMTYEYSVIETLDGEGAFLVPLCHLNCFTCRSQSINSS